MTLDKAVSGVIVLGADLKPVPDILLDHASETILQFHSYLEEKGYQGQIPTQTSLSSSTCNRTSESRVTTYSVSNQFISKRDGNPEQVYSIIEIIYRDCDPRADRSTERVRRHNPLYANSYNLPYWSSLLSVFARAVLKHSKESRATLAGAFLNDAYACGYEVWANADFDKKAEIETTLPGPLSNGDVFFQIPERYSRQTRLDKNIHLPPAVCLKILRSPCYSKVTISPLTISVPLDLDPIDRMALMAKYKKPE